MDDETVRSPQADETSAGASATEQSNPVENQYNDAISRAVDFETLDDRVLLSADLIPIEGAIDLPGERDAYVFTLSEPQSIFLDSIQADWRLRWTLESAQEVLVDNRRMPDSEAREVAAPLLSLAPGQYKLTIDAEGDFTGAYAFRLLNRANADTIELGVAQSPDLSKATRATLYTVDVAAGDRLLFDVRERSGQWPYLTLLDPQGQKVGDWPFYQSVTTGPLIQAGSYTLIVEGDSDWAGAMSFRVAKVEDRSETNALGTVISGALAGPGQTVRHQFSLAATTQVYLETLANSNLRWRLIGPSGRVAGDYNFASPNVASAANTLTLVAGNYTVEVFGQGSDVDTYAFAVRDLSNLPSIAINDEIELAIGDRGVSSSLGRSDLAPPVSGLPVGAKSHRASGPVPPLTAVAPTVDYNNLTLESWVRPEWSQQDNALILGQRYSTSTNYGYGLTTTAGGRVSFFVGGIGQLYSEPLASQSWAHVAGTFDGTYMRLYVDGVEVASLEKAQGAQVNRLDGYPFNIGGDHQSVSTHFNGLIDESRLWSRALGASEVAAGMSAAIAPDAANLAAYWRFDEADGHVAADATGTANAAAQYKPRLETQAFQVAGNAGQQVFFDVSANSGVYPTIRLLAPNGQQLTYARDANDPGRVTLPVDGNYIVLIEGTAANSSGGTLRFGLYDTAPTSGAAISLGGETTGAIATPGQVVEHALTVSEDGALLIDVVQGTAPMRWTLIDASGRTVASQRFSETSFITGWSNWGSMPYLKAGSYTLRVQADADQRNSYSLLVSRPEEAALLAEGRTTASSVDGGMWLRRISAEAGDVITLKRGNQMDGNLLIGLFDATGGIIRRSEWWSEYSYTVREDGDYFVLVEPYSSIANTLAIDVSLSIGSAVPSDPPGSAFSLGDTVEGNLGQHVAARRVLFLPDRAEPGSLRCADQFQLWLLRLDPYRIPDRLAGGRAAHGRTGSERGRCRTGRPAPDTAWHLSRHCPHGHVLATARLQVQDRLPGGASDGHWRRRGRERHSDGWPGHCRLQLQRSGGRTARNRRQRGGVCIV